METGPLVLDTDLRQLRRGGRVLPVSGLPLRIFEMLMAANGRIVSREKLKAALWPYAVRIDVDRRLHTAIRALRKAIIGLGGPADGIVREERWVIIPASEIMAIVALATSREDLEEQHVLVDVGEIAGVEDVAVLHGNPALLSARAVSFRRTIRARDPS